LVPIVFWIYPNTAREEERKRVANIWTKPTVYICIIDRLLHFGKIIPLFSTVPYQHLANDKRLGRQKKGKKNRRLLSPNTSSYIERERERKSNNIQRK